MSWRNFALWVSDDGLRTRIGPPAAESGRGASERWQRILSTMPIPSTLWSWTGSNRRPP